MEPITYPRVAIVSCNPLRADISNGIMMRSLFASWPQDRLAHIYFPLGAAYPPTFDICVDNRRIGPLGTVQRFTDKEASSEDTREPTPGNSASRLYWRRKMLVAVKQHARLFQWSKFLQEMWYGHSRVGRALYEQLKDCQPDIVYALLGNYSLAKNTLLACQQLELPLFVHVTDDYVRSLYHTMPFGRHVAAASEKWFRKCIQFSCGRAGISPMMAKEYSEEYGKPWETFTTGTAPEIYDPSPRASDNTIRFVYAGNLGLDRWRQLRTLATAFEQLSAQTQRKLILEIYSSAEQLDVHRQVLESSPNVTLGGWCPGGDLPSIFHEADVLVHVESFDKNLTALTRLSMSTKIYQYMMSGRPLLGFGPDNLASMQVIQDSQAGIVVSQNNPAALVAAIRDYYLEDDVRLDFGCQARTWAERWGDCRRERDRFQQALVAALERYQAEEAKHRSICLMPGHWEDDVAWHSKAS